jgi:glycosyltransferase involved in cell wall biosynthesis
VLKVAMLTYSTRPRGGVVHALKLAERLKGLGADITVYSLARSDDPYSLKKYFREVSVPFEIFPYDWSPDLMTRLDRMIASYTNHLPRDSDIYHAQDCVGGTSLASMKAMGLISAPVFRTIHHIDDFAEPRLFEFEKRAVAHADHRFVVSGYWKNALARDYGYDSIVTYNGIDVSDFMTGRAREAETPTILFVGGLEPRKGLEQLIHAMVDVVKKMPDAHLISVAKTGFRGTDEESWFRDLADRLGISGNIEFHESVTQETLLGFYAGCSIVVLPSRTEGWGLSLMEGMACGKAVVASRVGGIPELVRDGVDGILVDVGDVSELSRAVIKLLKDPVLRRRMGDAGRERVKEFSWDSTAKVVLEAYREALQTD